MLVQGSTRSPSSPRRQKSSSAGTCTHAEVGWLMLHLYKPELPPPCSVECRSCFIPQRVHSGLTGAVRRHGHDSILCALARHTSWWGSILNPTEVCSRSYATSAYLGVPGRYSPSARQNVSWCFLWDNEDPPIPMPSLSSAPTTGPGR